MGGVILYKVLKRLLICCIMVSVCWLLFLISDRRQLSHSLIRFHVVAASDSREDQEIKLKVRDAVLESIQGDLQKISDISEAREYLRENIPKVRMIVKRTLLENGFSGASAVNFCKEAFGIRHYDTFSLPAGVYDSFRITIGPGTGENWWCVAYPTLCIPATVADFKEAAFSAGFHEQTAEALAGNKKYFIRFYMLDCLGELENIFFSG